MLGTIRFKIFMGNVRLTADIEANYWMEDHPNIEILEMKYQQANAGDHSICIMYRLKEPMEVEDVVSTR